jgi:hypothetical protein
MSQDRDVVSPFGNINLLKYPVSRLDYTYKTGFIAEKLVSDILKEEGIDVEPHNVCENGVDIKAKDTHIGIEVWNWCKPHEYSSRIQSVLENLKPFQFRALVTSFISDTVKDYVINTYVMSPILIVELGFQILPKEYKEFYKNRKDVVFYPSKEAHIKVKSKMMSLITAIKRVRRDKILAKYFPSYDYGNMVILDATGCSKEEFNNFTRELEGHREKVALISVPEPSRESPSNKSLSTKEPFNAYVYRTNNRSVRMCNSSDRTGKIGGKSTISKSFRPKSSTFRDKLRWKMRRIPKFISETLSIFEPFLRFLSKVWHNECGSLTLANWITIKPKIKKPKNKTRRKLFQCPFRTIIICPHYKQFYACLYQMLIDYESHLEQYGFSEEQIHRMTDRLILDRTWKYKNLILTKCKCRPESIIDNEITSRIPIPRYGIALLDPCKSYRCPELIKEGKCEWLELLKENRAKPFQSKIPNYLEVKIQ